MQTTEKASSFIHSYSRGNRESQPFFALAQSVTALQATIRRHPQASVGVLLYWLQEGAAKLEKSE